MEFHASQFTHMLWAERFQIRKIKDSFQDWFLVVVHVFFKQLIHFNILVGLLLLVL